MSSKSILLVEDNEDDELLTIEALEASNLCNRIDVARNGVEAVDYLLGKGKFENRDIKDLPAVVLLDLNLPLMNGMEVLQVIRKTPHTKCLPVVILTSSVQDEDRLRGYSLGANSYVRKPVDFDEFLEAARQLGLYWLLINQSPPKN